MLMIRTDLALEAVDAINAEGSLQGVIREESKFCGVTVSRVRIISEEGVRQVNKPMGTYITVSSESFARSSPENLEQVKRCVAKELTELIKDKLNGGVLVVGLGNDRCTPDALGPKTAERILVTRHMARELRRILDIPDLATVSCVAPGVLGQTGVETGEIVRGVADRIKPSLVIAVDALAARSVDRLGSTVQLATCGICPGSGVNNKRSELSERTLGVEVISIGVPMVVDVGTLVADVTGDDSGELVSSASREMIVTPREIDLLTEHSASLVADALNRALFQSLDPEDIAALSGS